MGAVSVLDFPLFLFQWTYDAWSEMIVPFSAPEVQDPFRQSKNQNAI